MTIESSTSNETFFYLWEIVIIMINWEQDIVPSNSVCNHTRD